VVHFNWTQLIPGVTHDNVHVATAAASAGVMTLLAVAGRFALGSGDHAVMPAGRFSLKGVFEIITEFIVGLVDMVIGEHGRKFVPMFAAIFFYIWASNLIGILPGMTPSTDNINTTLSLGLFSFVIYNFFGLKENGLSYLKHFLGPVMWLAPLMVMIEIISHVIRPLTLGLRLAGNITADHTVLSIFLDLAPWGVPMAFYVMGLFVASIQAFVFTILSMIYISMATAHDH
jgi:F-type H+-transporting ATPase subunit a